MRMDSRRSTEPEPSRRERAVSDVIGFSLMFGIIIVGVGVVSVGGLDDVLAFGDREEVATGERGMEAAASTLDKLNQQADMNRSFTLVVGTGNVWMNETNLTFDGADGIADDIGEEGTIQVNALEHRFNRNPDDISVIYEAGGVYRSDSIATRYRPSFACKTDSDNAILSVVNLTDDGSGINVAVGFNRQFAIDPTSIPDESPIAAFAETLTLQADVSDWQTVTRTNLAPGEELQIDVSDTSNPAAWAHHLENAGWDEQADSTFACDAETVVIRTTTIDLRRLI